MRRREYYWSLYHEPEQNQLDSLRTDQVEAIYQALPTKLRSEFLIWRDGMPGWVSFSDFPNLILALRSSSEAPIAAPPPVRGKTEVNYERAKSVSLDPNKTLVIAKNTDPQKTKVSRQSKGRRREDGEDTQTNLKGKNRRRRDENFNEDHTYRIGRDEVVDLASPDDDPDDLMIAEGGIAEGRNTVRVGKKFQVRIMFGEKIVENTTRNISMRGMQLFDPLPSGLPRYFSVQVYRGKTVIPLVCSEVKSKDGSPSRRLKIEVNDYENALLTLLLAG